MKKLLLANLFFFAVPFFCLAQQAPGTTQLGVVAGPTHTFIKRTNLSSPQFENIDSDFRIAAGLSLKHSFGWLFLKGDLLYENKGFKSDYRHFSENGQFTDGYYIKSHFHYLTLPILAGVDIKNTGLFVNVGPYLGVLLKHKHTSDAPIEFSDDDWEYNYKKMDVGVSGGIGYSRAISSTLSVSAEARYNKGFYDIRKSSEVYNSNSTNVLFGLHYNLAGK